MINRDKKLAREILNKRNKCELCGETRNLEVHHVIPMCINNFAPGINLDCEENMIVACGSCHAKLTNRSLIIKIGLQSKKYFNDCKKQFYIKLLKEYEQGNLTVVDVLDIFDEWIKELSTGEYNEQEQEKSK